MKQAFAIASLLGLSFGLLADHQRVHAEPEVGTPCRITWESDKPDQEGLCDTYTLGVDTGNKVIFMSNEWMFKFLSSDKGKTYDMKQEGGEDVYSLKDDRYGRAVFSIYTN